MDKRTVGWIFLNFYTINSTHSFQQNLTPSREANARTRYICHMPICDSLRQGQVGNPPLTIIQPPPPPPRDTGGDWSVAHNPGSTTHNGLCLSGPGRRRCSSEVLLSVQLVCSLCRPSLQLDSQLQQDLSSSSPVQTHIFTALKHLFPPLNHK